MDRRMGVPTGSPLYAPSLLVLSSLIDSFKALATLPHAPLFKSILGLSFQVEGMAGVYAYTALYIHTVSTLALMLCMGTVVYGHTVG